jgi:hypothetical protein
MGTNTVTPFRRWQLEANPMLTSMMAVLYLAQDATTRGPQAILSASDQLRAASTEAVLWIPEHRCPFSGLDTMLTRLACAYGNVASLMSAEAKQPGGPNLRMLDRELNNLIGMLAVTWAVIREQSGAESLA